MSGHTSGASFLSDLCAGVCVCVTCVECEARLLAHVAQADRDAVPASRLQVSQQVLHCVVAGAQLVVFLRLADHVPHVDHVHLQLQTRKQTSTHRHTLTTAGVILILMLSL